jgi:hypothetical protein
MSYFYSRDEIYKHILLQKQTSCGVFWCLDLKDKLLKLGNVEDTVYFLNRTVFASKVFWTQKDFYYFLAKTENKKMYFKDWYNLNLKFNSENQDILKKRINEKLDNLLVSDIIDNYLIFNDYFFEI